MVSIGTFDSSKVEPQTAFELLPPGLYKLRLVDATEKPTKAGTGSYINMQFEVVEPAQYNGRRVFDMLNLNNPSEKAVQISQARLSALTRAAGLGTISDTDELLMRPVLAKIKVKPATNGYDASNAISDYIYENAPPVVTAPQVVALSGAQPKSATPSWATPK